MPEPTYISGRLRGPQAPPPPAPPIGSIRVTLLNLQLSTGIAPDTATAKIQVKSGSQNGLSISLGTISLNVATDFINITSLLQTNGSFYLNNQIMMDLVITQPFYLGGVKYTTGAINNLRAKLEWSGKNPNTGQAVVTSGTDTVTGPNLLFLAPAATGWASPSGATGYELMSAHATAYLGQAQTVECVHKPAQFILSAFICIGYQSHAGHLASCIQTLKKLGINTIAAYSWDTLNTQTISGQNAIDYTVSQNGITQRLWTAYSPPDYLNYPQDKMNPVALQTWAENISGVNGHVAGAYKYNTGGDYAAVVWHSMSDEPAAYLPGRIYDIQNNPSYLAYFQNWMQNDANGPGAAGLTPGDFGVASWADMVPNTVSQAVDLPSCRLYYWTVRFFIEDFSTAYINLQAALRAAYANNNTMLCPVNLNDYWNRWCVATPNVHYGANPYSNADCALICPDAFSLARRQAATPWTETWGYPVLLERIAGWADMLRCAAMQHDPMLPFGSYLITGTTYNYPNTYDQPTVLALHVMTFIGRGAKALDLYAWGNPWFFANPGFSEPYRYVLYGQISDSLNLIGAAESVLYPGVPSRGKVAIYLSGASGIWDTAYASQGYHYLLELQWLHLALTHAGYTVDFIDSTDIISGALASRGYTALYLTEPNIRAAAATTIVSWVNAGGVLTLLPGAATHDEYNSASTTIADILGLASWPTSRMFTNSSYTSWSTTNTGSNGTVTVDAAYPSFGSGSSTVYGKALSSPALELTPTTAAIAARWGDTNAAIALNTVGSGQAITYGFYPGANYWITSTRSLTDLGQGLPSAWLGAYRSLAVAPAVLANTPRPVTLSVPAVEANLLSSPSGIAVVLLNWTGANVPSLTVTVASPGAFTTVTSVRQGALPATSGPDGLTFTLSLNNPADVVTIT